MTRGPNCSARRRPQRFAANAVLIVAFVSTFAGCRSSAKSPAATTTTTTTTAAARPAAASDIENLISAWYESLESVGIDLVFEMSFDDASVIIATAEVALDRRAQTATMITSEPVAIGSSEMEVTERVAVVGATSWRQRPGDQWEGSPETADEMVGGLGRDKGPDLAASLLEFVRRGTDWTIGDSSRGQQHFISDDPASGERLSLVFDRDGALVESSEVGPPSGVDPADPNDVRRGSTTMRFRDLNAIEVEIPQDLPG